MCNYCEITVACVLVLTAGGAIQLFFVTVTVIQHYRRSYLRAILQFNHLLKLSWRTNSITGQKDLVSVCVSVCVCVLTRVA